MPFFIYYLTKPCIIDLIMNLINENPINELYKIINNSNSLKRYFSSKIHSMLI